MEESVPKKNVKTALDQFEQATRMINLYSIVIASDNTEINLLCMPHHFKMKIEHLSEEERAILTIKYDRFRHLKQKRSVLKRKLNQQGVDVNERLLEVKKAEILELFGAYYNIEEVHKKLIESTGVAIDISTIRKFQNKYRLEIEKLQSDYDKNVGTIGISKKRSRLEQIDYMLRRLKQEFDSSTGKHLLPFVREMKNLLEQARKEVEGDKLQLNIDGTININATIESMKSIEELYADLNFNQLIIAMMAKQQRVNPLMMHYRMLDSYYNKHTGFNQQTFDMDEVIDYPSKLITGWDEVKDKVKEKEAENQTLQQKFEKYIEDYIDKPDSKTPLKNELKEKIRDGRVEIKKATERLKMPKKDVKAIIEKIKKQNIAKNNL